MLSNKFNDSSFSVNWKKWFFSFYAIAMAEQISLKWNEYQENLQTLVKSLKGKDNFVDVTLVCEDGHDSRLTKWF